MLGPVVSFFGIANGACECTRPICDRPGKHPRARTGWIKSATTDLNLIETTLAAFPLSNFALVPGHRSIALDLDTHPGKPNGIDYLAKHGELPKTVTVDSGGGGKHLYFQVPAFFENLKGHDGVDIKMNAVIVPPSIHFSGNRYAWAQGLSPAEIDLAPLPEWITGLFLKADSQRLDAQGAIVGERPKEAPPAGRERPDWVVKMNWMRNLKTRADRSSTDLINASSLAFWCAHNWEQYLRMWYGSDVRSGKYQNPYIELMMLTTAFKNKQESFKPKPKPRRNPNPSPLLKEMYRLEDQKRKHPAIPKGKKTLSVLALHQAEPDLTQTQIATRLGFSRQCVHQIFSRFVNTLL